MEFTAVHFGCLQYRILVALYIRDLSSNYISSYVFEIYGKEIEKYNIPYPLNLISINHELVIVWWGFFQVDGTSADLTVLEELHYIAILWFCEVVNDHPN